MRQGLGPKQHDEMSEINRNITLSIRVIMPNVVDSGIANHDMINDEG